MADPIEALGATMASTKRRSTLDMAFDDMAEGERETWEAILMGAQRRPDGAPYGSSHVVRAMRHCGYNVSINAVRTWRAEHGIPNG